MDSAMGKKLAEAIRAIESGADFDVVVARYPGYEDALRSHLSLWRRLDAVPRVEPDAVAVNNGRAAMLAALATPVASPAPLAGLAKAFAVVAGVFILGAGAAGASGALGGPDFAGTALESVGVSDDVNGNDSGDGPSPHDADVTGDESDGAVSDGESESAANGNPSENANANATEGCANSQDGRNNSNEYAENGDTNANPRAFEGGNSENCSDDAPAATDGADSNNGSGQEGNNGNGPNPNGGGGSDTDNGNSDAGSENGQGTPPEDPGNSSSSNQGGNGNDQGSPQGGQ
jgi:hypothetical protein